MSEQPEVVAKLKLDTSDADKSVDTFDKKVSNLGKYIAGLGIGAGIAFAFKKSVDAAIEAEDAVRSLNSAMAVTGTFSQQASEAFQSFASSLQSTTGVSDDLITKNAALLVSVGKLSGEGLNNATKAALDLAAGLQIDVSQAFDVMTKASQGNVGMLAKYGLQVSSSASDSQKFAAALQFVNTQFGGMAQNKAESFGGSIQKLSNAFNDIFESVGNIFQNSKMFRAVILLIGEAFEGFAKKLDGFAKSGDVLKPIINSMLEFGQNVIKYAIRPMEIFITLLTSSLLVAVSGALGALGWLAKGLDKIAGTELAGALALIKEDVDKAQAEMHEKWTSNDTAFSDSMLNSVTTFATAVNAKAATISDTQKNIAMQTQQNTSYVEEFWTAFGGGYGSMTELLKELHTQVAQLGKQIRGTLVSGIGNAFNQMGQALVKGANLFDAFGKAVLGMLGQMAMQMGQFFIATGIAMLFTPGGGGQGAALIAAGAALSVLGGVLSALGSGGGSGSSVGATTSGTASGGEAATAGGSMLASEERAKPQTGVNIYVQGNVLDRRSTGLELAQILNEAYDTDGVTVRAVAGVV